MREHKITDSKLRLVIGFDNVRVLRDLGETHGEGLAYGSDFFGRDLYLLSDVIVRDVGISNKVLTDL